MEREKKRLHVMKESNKKSKVETVKEENDMRGPRVSLLKGDCGCWGVGAAGMVTKI